MTDFDAALERLLTEPGFARALAADPGAALAGYQLSAEELAVLTTQLAEGVGAAHGVELRTNQSSLAGMLNPLAATGDLLGLDQAVPPESGLGTAPQRGLGEAPAAGRPEPGAEGQPVKQGIAPAPQPEPVLPEGYQTRVDVDGDGSWDAHTLQATAGGGVDIQVDRDGDGRLDFIGHDEDADGLVDWSEYDRDGDGRFETRMYDDNGDGWMDRTETAGSG